MANDDKATMDWHNDGGSPKKSKTLMEASKFPSYKDRTSNIKHAESKLMPQQQTQVDDQMAKKDAELKGKQKGARFTEDGDDVDDGTLVMTSEGKQKHSYDVNTFADLNEAPKYTEEGAIPERESRVVVQLDTHKDETAYFGNHEDMHGMKDTMNHATDHNAHGVSHHGHYDNHHTNTKKQGQKTGKDRRLYVDSVHTPLREFLQQMTKYGGVENFLWLLKSVDLKNLKAELFSLNVLKTNATTKELFEGEANRVHLIRLLDNVNAIGGVKQTNLILDEEIK